MNSSKKALVSTLVLVILLILCGISTYCISNLYIPDKEISSSEKQLEKERKEIYSFTADSEERKAQEAKYQEAFELNAKIMNEYTASGNPLVNGYSHIQNNTLKVLIRIACVLPFILTILMFLGSPINFIFSIINLIIVLPVKILVFAFNAFRPERKSENKKPSHLKLNEAAN